jgi:formamidopyrimidine-DNA glycosylase
VWLRFDEGETARRLAFVDPRRFGTGELALGPEALEAFFAARLGHEPFAGAFTAEHLYTLARTSRAPIKALLLDQKRVAGVGNIYADEALFRAGIHPLRPANRLTAAQCGALRDAVVAALEAGIAAKGATIDDFRDPDGARGSFQDQFLVHRREGEPCPTCGRPIRKLRAAGRGTYVCERCQPRPRAARYAASARSVRRPARSA